jgi:hypothetical protein
MSRSFSARRLVVWVLSGFCLLAASVQGRAQTPPDPYQVTPQAGPWMICCASYTGADAPFLAQQFARTLRERDRIAAYTFNHADEERRKFQEEQDRFRQEHPDLPLRRRIIRVEEQCAVLVGGYPSMEAARTALDSIKKLRPPEVRTRTGELAGDRVINLVPAGDGRKEVHQALVNPLANSFVVRNPTVKQEKQQEAPVDPFWKELNEEESYSLLNNPKTWTLVIKEYRGASTVQSSVGESNFVNKLQNNGKQTALLTLSGMQAHELARFLRQYNYDTYVLHTRYSSIVTVGGFASLEDPEFKRLQQQLVALRLQPQGGNNTNLDLMNPPLPMKVPRIP